jgi:hypothetical protein
MEKLLGKIQSTELQISDHGHLLVEIYFVGLSWSVGTYISSKEPEKIKQYLEDAKVNKLSQLIGKPVEVIFKGSCLDSWRILTEVI